MTIQAVIFDLDGVLVDSEIWWDEVRIDFATEQGRPWTRADQAAVMGQNSRQWARTMRDRLGLDLPLEEIERRIVEGVVDRYRREGAPTIEGAVAAVERIAARYPVAVASSAHRAVIDAALVGLGIANRFDAVVSSDDVPHGKPEPDVYLEAARRLGVPPEHCLVVEDSLNGARAGRAAGMTVVLVPNASVPPAPGAREAAHHEREALAEVVALLDPPGAAPGGVGKGGSGR
jgi:HAD superfamily hydrolase (TIGR01509 family)